ncbi:hypothetical protein A2264_05320 [candidate division WWE3 bacterium RIFOXYA2_FULL_46_9]|uniref:Sortase n=1 Tax=candidate division WWE3 bacterium RIFOXYA2_FULL_46_9 TaxID=1802636 RepID=A0A1F4VZB0_UNCKA|nr:MAG: hypothetical protein A2264_05320 [candidate division WWE3 bacterium RIFOXYA2_FULL_46_9]OGC70632.1 MAG: hypothetical protein A2602_04085 [candidate division WWE3 bacterium RIFOXYD1_FULL_40_11]HLD51343.1 class F sortase [Patescibacteria group bacterium]
MKKRRFINFRHLFLPAVLLGVCMLLSLFLIWDFLPKPPIESNLENRLSITDLSVFSELTEPVYFPAEIITIPGTNIATTLDRVGVLDDGTLEAPEAWNKGGWLFSSSKPGQVGNLIIDGHYDDNFGKPAVFWELKKVKPGDKVIVTDGAGEDFVYIVSKVYFLDIDSSEKSRVFSSNEKVATITLITCGGVWLPGESTYSKRLIVSGVLDSGANGLAKALMSYYVASYVN